MIKLNEEIIFRVLSIVEEIPWGKVSTYQQVANLAGIEKNSRLVGRILKMSSMYGHYPCHRVVNFQGQLVPGWNEQRDLLESEKILVVNNKVNLKKYLWDQ